MPKAVLMLTDWLWLMFYCTGCLTWNAQEARKGTTRPQGEQNPISLAGNKKLAPG